MLKALKWKNKVQDERELNVMSKELEENLMKKILQIIFFFPSIKKRINYVQKGFTPN